MCLPCFQLVISRDALCISCFTPVEEFEEGILTRTGAFVRNASTRSTARSGRSGGSGAAPPAPGMPPTP
eukprot:CAMPEP_0174922746 /NCGR_PEP_ID=MMETSP1355-20121228/6107_1 /TAXON_ID=464990 /ORGANISM="Hemiselmis tepida, Strain CCMP443" /LENGTH=68 /DNA_ID=CAMNT_0016168371 /DNA_START=193 /DNA_END=395 /DNA_ORIENTATION=+